MCLLARCQYLNSLCQGEVIQAQAFSIVMVTRELQLTSADKCTESQLGRVLSWIKSNRDNLVIFKLKKSFSFHCYLSFNYKLLGLNSSTKIHFACIGTLNF